MSEAKVLIVMRHAKSSWKTYTTDRKRQLSRRGTRDAVVAGQILGRFNLDTVLCSSAARTKQTWQSAKMGGARCKDVHYLDSLYLTDVDTALAELAKLPDTVQTVLLIGHEPTCSSLISHLARPNTLVDEVQEKFRTSTIAVLAHSRSWAELGAQTTDLLAVEVPRG